MQVIPHPVGDITFGDSPQIDLHSLACKKHAAVGVIQYHVRRIRDTQQGGDLVRGRYSVPLKANFPAFDQRTYRQVERTVCRQAGRFRAADQVKHRATDDNRMLTGSMVDIHHLRMRTVDGEEIFVLFDQAKHAGREGFVMGEEFQEDGRAHQNGVVAVNAMAIRHCISPQM